MSIKTLNITLVTAGVALLGSLVATTSAIAKDSDFVKLVSKQEQQVMSESTAPVELREKLSFEDSRQLGEGEEVIQISACLNRLTGRPTQIRCNF